MMMSRGMTACIFRPKSVGITRFFSTSYFHFAKPLPPRLVIPETDIEESFLKGSGPGGQKINKTNSAVQLKHIPTGIVVKCQETRSRDQNREIARRLLADKIEHEQNGDSSRVSIKADLAAKKRASKLKKSRRKYRKLDEDKGDGEKDQTSKLADKESMSKISDD